MQIFNFDEFGRLFLRAGGIKKALEDHGPVLVVDYQRRGPDHDIVAMTFEQYRELVRKAHG